MPKERINKYFAPGTPVKQMEDTIVKALEIYRKSVAKRKTGNVKGFPQGHQYVLMWIAFFRSPFPHPTPSFTSRLPAEKTKGAGGYPLFDSMQRWKPGEERRFICIEVGLYYVFERKEKKDVRKSEEERQEDHSIYIKSADNDIYGKFFCCNSTCGGWDIIF